MSNDVGRVCEGPIPGLLLPPHVWHILEYANITTLHQLTAVADQIERVVPGIGPKMAEVIRAELARLAALKQLRKGDQSSDP